MKRRLIINLLFLFILVPAFASAGNLVLKASSPATSLITNVDGYAIKPGDQSPAIISNQQFCVAPGYHAGSGLQKNIHCFNGYLSILHHLVVNLFASRFNDFYDKRNVCFVFILPIISGNFLPLLLMPDNAIILVKPSSVSF